MVTMNKIENMVKYVLELFVIPLAISVASKYYEEKIENKRNKIKQYQTLNWKLNRKLIQYEMLGGLLLAIVFEFLFLLRSHYTLGRNHIVIITAFCLSLSILYLILLYKMTKKYTESAKCKWISNSGISIFITLLFWIILQNKNENSMAIWIFIFLIITGQCLNNLEVKKIYNVKYIIRFKKKKYKIDSEPVVEEPFLSFNYTCQGGEKKYLKVPIKKVKCIELVVEKCIT